jgi:hypothetical protein
MFGQRKRSESVAPLLRRIIRPTITLIQTQKQNIPERCFFWILNYLDFEDSAWTCEYLRLDGRAIVFNFPIWETTCYFPTRVSKVTISFMYFEKKTILRSENKAFPKRVGRSTGSKSLRLQGLCARYPRTEHGLGEVLGVRMRFLVEAPALFTRFPRSPLRHQYDEH